MLNLINVGLLGHKDCWKPLVLLLFLVIEGKFLCDIKGMVKGYWLGEEGWQWKICVVTELGLKGLSD